MSKPAKGTITEMCLIQKDFYVGKINRFNGRRMKVIDIDAQVANGFVRLGIRWEDIGKDYRRKRPCQ
jgi:hypothetical protein